MDCIEHLEVENFKSYKGHQLIGPFKNFTAIIGANGTGKSNLMDAISFVFGVQTAMLRGALLQDLVYQRPEGTSTKRIKSYVKLVLARANNSRVNFQRSVVDGGGSEYSINGSTVRREEYEARLGEFNINVKAENFLVFQGGVERIAQKSPRELTELIEQVSGSYELKTEYERLSADRDKVIENAQFIFKKQKGMRAEKKQYKDQCREADNYNELKESYRRCHLQCILFQLFHIGKDVGEFEREKQKWSGELETIREKQSKVEGKLEAKRKELAKRQQALAKVKRDMDAKKLQTEKYGLAVIQMRKELEHLAKRKESNEQALSAQRESQKRHAQKIQSLRDELNEVHAEEQRYNEQQEKVQQACRNVSLSKAQLEEWYRVKEEAKLKTADDRALLAQAENLLEADRSLLNQCEMEMREYQSRLEVLEEQRAALLQKREQSCRAESEANEALKVAKEELEGIERENATAHARQRELEDQLNEVQDQLREMRVQVSEVDRRGRMEECLSALQRLFSGVYGRMFDLVNPSAPKYKIALTVVLGSNMDSIVVSDQKVAIECIKYMRDQRLGVATFLPLDTIKVNRVDDRLRSLHVEVKPVVDALEYAPQYRQAVEYVCGNTLMCPDLELARKFAFDQSHRNKVVTYDGTMITKSGLITGGISGVEGRARRWDLKEVMQVKSRRDQLTASLSEVSQSLRGAAHLQTLQSTMAKLESKLKALKFEKELTDDRLSKLEESVDVLNRSMARLRPEYDRLRLVVNERQSAIDAIKSSILRIEDALFLSFSEKVGVDHIREWDDSRKHWLRQQAEAHLRFTSQCARINNLIEYENQRNEAHLMRDLEERIEKDQATYAKTLEGVREAQARLDKLQDVASLRQKHAELYQLVVESENELKSLRKDYDIRQRLCNQISKKISAKDRSIDQLKEKRHQIYKSCVMDGILLPIARGHEFLPSPLILSSTMATDDDNEVSSTAALDHHQEVNKSVLSDEDQIEISFSPHLSKSQMDLSTISQCDEQSTALSAQLHSLKVHMDNIAPNMKATEHLEEANKKIERMDHTLEEAKAQARELINKFEAVREQRNDRFMKAFHCISARIDAVYKGLTNQFGVAHLTLDSNDEPYLHATRFSAVPPYKMYHDIEDLSGGEKSVAALALLFAIHSFRPSPFFIMDEVDAALDPNNVKIVAQYFKAQSERMQLIVISLKDRCFEHADALIGVYVDRAEDTSKTLTLDLTKYE